MTIRPARIEDIPALLEIYNYEVINGTATLDINPRTLPEWENWFREHQTEEHFVLTAEINGVPAGYASLSEYRSKEAYRSTAELSVYVGQEFRRQGVASALIAEVLRIARERNTLHSVVSVITAGNNASKRLHGKFGFMACGTLRQVGFKHGKYQDIDNFELILDKE